MGHQHRGEQQHGDPKHQAGNSESNPLYVKLLLGKNKQAPEGKGDQECCHGEHKPPKWWRMSEWWTAIGTVVLAIFALGSFSLLWKQLNDAREVFSRDQRAWVVATVKPTQRFYPQVRVTSQIQLANTGKTPAKKIHGEFVIQSVNSGETPRLTLIDTYRTIDDTGIMYPNAPPENIPATWLQLNPATKQIEPALPTPQQIKDFGAGKLFFIMYGRVTYLDVFGLHHWTQFCELVSGDPTTIHSSPQCVKYNDAGDD